MIEIIGYIGSFLLAICGFPLAYRSWKEGHSKNVDKTFFYIWFFGEVFCFIYVLALDKLPLILNYGVNLVLLLVVFKYMIRPRSK